MEKTLLLFILAIVSSVAMKAQTVSNFVGAPLQFSVVVDTSQTFSSARFYDANKILFDKKGNGWVIEQGGNRLRMIDSANTIVVVRAGSAKSDTGSVNSIIGTSARFNFPVDIAMDNNGNIYVADAGNNCIRKVSAFTNLNTPQVVTTYAGVMSNVGGYINGSAATAQFNHPNSLAIDNAGNIYVVEMYNNCIRKISTNGAVTTLAGSITGINGDIDGVGINARFQFPNQMCWYSDSELIVGDGNLKIKKVNINTQSVTTFAGTGTYGDIDGDALTQATFPGVGSIGMDSSKNVYEIDNYVIRKITGSCVTTFAGSLGNRGYTNGTDTNARFWGPVGISYYNGAMYFIDAGLIRKITVPGLPKDPIPTAKFSIPSVGNPGKIYHLIDSTTGNFYTGIQKWNISPSSFSYVNGTGSTSTDAQVTFNTKTLYTITLTDKNCWGNNSKVATINISNTGVNEVNADKYISVYPNPTTGFFEISINTIEANSIRVMDINGKTIIERKIISSKESIDMTGFAKGVYILNISGNEFSLNKKLILE